MVALTQKRVCELLDYDPATGVFIWKFRADAKYKGWNTRFAGKVAGGSHGGDGYLCVGIDGNRYLLHHVAWLYVYGIWPTEIDHENHVRSDNRINNLSDGTRLDNAKNHTLQSNNTSGHVGVYWNKQRDMWRAYVYVGKKQKHLGHFDRFEDAVAARITANDNLRFHENHGERLVV